MLLFMTDLLGLLLSTILVLLIELIESVLEHKVDILRYINVYVLFRTNINNFDMIFLSVYCRKFFKTPFLSFFLQKGTYDHSHLYRLKITLKAQHQ